MEFRVKWPGQRGRTAQAVLSASLDDPAHSPPLSPKDQGDLDAAYRGLGHLQRVIPSRHRMLRFIAWFLITRDGIGKSTVKSTAAEHEKYGSFTGATWSDRSWSWLRREPRSAQPGPASELSISGNRDGPAWRRWHARCGRSRRRCAGGAGQRASPATRTRCRPGSGWHRRLAAAVAGRGAALVG
jgi:hypothetical protein